MPKETIYIGSDHAGYELKQHVMAFLKKKGVSYKDLGCYNADRCDYPDYAKKVAKAVLKNKNSRGILICGTGIGMCIAANRFKGIRAALCHDKTTAEMSRKHNNSNVLCMGGRLLKQKNALEITDVWLKTEFEAGRHQKRLDKIDRR